MSKLYTLKARLLNNRFGFTPWSAKFEIPETSTLYNLHEAVIEFLEFNPMHLHEFFIGRSWSSRKSIIGDDAYCDDAFANLREAENIPLSSIFPLPEAHNLYYLFDFGANWQLAIRKLNPEGLTDKATQYPRLIEEKGKRPLQYGD